MHSALKKINARVKQLQKKHPKSKRVTLQKQAGREYKAGKLKGKIGSSRGNTSGNTRTATKASTSRNRTATSTKTITAHVKVGAMKRKKRHAKRRVARKRVTHKRKSVGRVRTRTVNRIVYRTRKVSGGMNMKSMIPILAIAAVGGIAYMLLKKPATPIYMPTGNTVRDASANNVIAYATALGLAGTALAKLIESLNNSSDDQVANAGSNPKGFIDYMGI